MTDRLDLPDRYRRQVEALRREHLPGIEVWAYGSRINGRSHPGSDLDLVLRGKDLKPVPFSKLSEVSKAFRESNIPFLVEVRNWAWLPESFHRQIERDHVVLLTADKQSS